MCHQNIMCYRHIRKRALPTRFVFKHASPSRAFDVRNDFPNPFNFPHSRFKAQYFPQLKKHETLAGEKGGIMGTMVFRPTTPWAQGLLGCLAHVVKWPKPTYHIKTMGRHLDGRILKRARMSSHGLAPRRLV